MSDSLISFKILAHDGQSRARVGRLTTPHGSIETPNFFFCATKGAIKTLSPQQLHQADVAGLLANTYHLMIQPGTQVIEEAGGLHQFMNWSKPLMTDSGGFQIFAMGHGSVANEIKKHRHHSWPHSLLKITEEGALFRSYLDGRKVHLSPESAVSIQRSLGSDLIMPLDECTPFHVDRDYTERSMMMSLRGGDICRAPAGALQISTANTTIHGSPERPVHLLGVGDIDDILMMVKQGVDTFDCVTPTRIARHGWALHRHAKKYRINLYNAKHRHNHMPIDQNCSCYTCKRFTCAYLHHLFKAKEILGMHLITLHNVVVMVTFMREIREAIIKQTVIQ